MRYSFKHWDWIAPVLWSLVMTLLRIVLIGALLAVSGAVGALALWWYFTLKGF